MTFREPFYLPGAVPNFTVGNGEGVALVSRWDSTGRAEPLRTSDGEPLT